MMKIGYAYPGFIYLPLFLADSRRDLEEISAELLDCAKGDATALRQLDSPRDEEHADVVLCDPLVPGLTNAALPPATGRKQPPVVVASVIRNMPAWLYNSGDNIQPIHKECQLRELRGLTSITCYESPNTGYLIGKRLQEASTISNLYTIPFGEDTFDSRNPADVLVTSDILQVSKCLLTKPPLTSNFSPTSKIIFSYATRTTDVEGMFFTGVLTTKAYLKADLVNILRFLTVLKKSIVSIQKDDPAELANEIYQIQTDHLDVQKQFPPGTPASEIRKYIKFAITKLFRDEEIYSNDLRVKKEDWERNVSLRQKYGEKDWKPLGFNQFVSLLPAELIHDTWMDRIEEVVNPLPAVPIQDTWIDTLLGWVRATFSWVRATFSWVRATSDDLSNSRWFSGALLVLALVLCYAWWHNFDSDCQIEFSIYRLFSTTSCSNIEILLYSFLAFAHGHLCLRLAIEFFTSVRPRFNASAGYTFALIGVLWTMLSIARAGTE